MSPEGLKVKEKVRYANMLSLGAINHDFSFLN